MTPKQIASIVRQALQEDQAARDVTTLSLIPGAARARARIVAKQAGVICGLAFARQAFEQLDPKVRFLAVVSDGKKVSVGRTVAIVSGLARSLLSAERVAINFLGYLSGIATYTQQCVTAVKPYKAVVMDTRKTTPTLRWLERYAVTCGGGVNHRLDLSSAAMIKDNHLAVLSRSMAAAEMVTAIRNRRCVQVVLEVDDLKHFKEAVSSGAEVILLDNFSPPQVRKAVELRQAAKSRVLLEASGGIHLKNIRLFAAAGVDRISVGALTHSRQGFDLSLQFE